MAVASFATTWPVGSSSALSLTVAFAAPLVLGSWGFAGALVGVFAGSLAGGRSVAAALLLAAAMTVPAAVAAAHLRREARSPARSIGVTLALATATTLASALAADPSPSWPDLLRALPRFVVAAAIPAATLGVARDAEGRDRSFVASVLDKLPAVVFLKDARGRYVVVNRAFEAFVGRGRAELLGRTDRELFPGALAERFEREDREVLATARMIDVEQDIPAGPVPHVFIVSKFPLFGTNGGLDGVGGIASDITELRRLFQVVRESEGRLRDVVEHSSNLFYVRSVEHVFTYVSPQSRHFFGCDPEEALVRWTAFVPDPESNRLAMEVTERAIRTGERQPPYEVEVRTRAGRALWVEVNEAPVVRDGRTVAIVGALIDIDQRRRAERGLRRALSLLEATLEASGEGILVVDRAGRFARYNQQFVEMWGVPPAILASGEDARLVEHAMGQVSDPARFAARVQDFYASPEVEGLDVLHFVDGRIVERYSRPQRLDGEIVGRVWSFRDVTARRRAEEELRRHRDHLAELVAARTRELSATNRELETFCYTVSHDLRAPLRAIDGFSRVLAEEAGACLDDDAMRHLDRIRGAAGRMARLIDDLLQLSRVSRCALRRDPVDLAALARSIVVDLRAGDPTRDVEFAIEGPLAADGDASLLRSLLQNLLENAWKFSAGRERAHIAIGERREGGERVFFVRDDGAGFDMDYADRLFVPFERLHEAGAFEGTGIGLATVKRIAERHGGRVWAESAVGAGATFFFTLGPSDTERPPA